LPAVDPGAYNDRVENLAPALPSPIRFDPDDPEYIRDPYPTYRLLREYAPAYYWSEGRAWVFSRYHDVVAILRDKRFSLDIQDWEHAQVRSESETSEFERLTAKALFTLPPEEQARVRKLSGRAFTPRALEWMRAAVQAVVDESLRHADETEIFNLARDFAETIPVRAIGVMLGVPADQAECFLRFGESVSNTARPGIAQDERDRLLLPFADGLELLRSLISQRRREPGTDVLSVLTAAHDRGDRLTDDEIIELVMSLITAGTETSAHLICFGVLSLLRNPDQLALLRREPGLMRTAIDEILRYDSFAKNGVARFALQETEIGGVTITKGQMVFPLLAAALRDPEVFTDPDVFDIRRDPTPNIAFGTGPHHCIGAPLARLQGEVAIGTLVNRYPALSLAGDPTFVNDPLLRKMSALPVRLR
jgi:cytochrome P450 enzyme